MPGLEERTPFSAPNFVRAADGCIPASNAPIVQPANCPVGSYYSTSSGYRRIPATTCQGGATLDTPVQRPCGMALPLAAPRGWLPVDLMHSDAARIGDRERTHAPTFGLGRRWHSGWRTDGDSDEPAQRRRSFRFGALDRWRNCVSYRPHGHDGH